MRLNKRQNAKADMKLMQQPYQGLKPMSPVGTFGDAKSASPDLEKREIPWNQPVRAEERKAARSPDELVELFADQVWRFVSSQVVRKEDAEDLVQEVFTAAFSSYGKVSAADDQRLWLFAIARNKISSYLRQRYRRAEQPLPETHLAESPTDATELQHVVRDGIRTLLPDQAEVLVLKYVSGLSTEEVAQVVRKSLPATNSLLQRARAAFKEALGPTFADHARNIS